MTMASGEVQHHTEHSNSDPQATAAAMAAHVRGESEAQQRQDHHMRTAQAGYAGDLMPAESTLQSQAGSTPTGRSTL